jgi:hypothetical protein
MNIKTEEQLPGCWVAYDEDTYDGPGSPIGSSTRSEQEAIDDLFDQLPDEAFGDFPFPGFSVFGG